MKPQTVIRPRLRPHQGRRGFALVITLSLMILLALLAVGLLSLSAVSLRSSSLGESLALAKSNARLAMLMALGDLQRETGTDRAITVPASQIDEDLPQGVTGSWTAWVITQEDTSRAESDKRFQRWLISSPAPLAPHSPQRPLLAKPDDRAATLLLGNGTLGVRQQQMKDDQRIALNPTGLATGNQKGSLAWVVIDENAKSRVDLYDDTEQLKAARNVARAGAPPTDGVSLLSGWREFKVREEEKGKLATTASVPLTKLVRPTNVPVHDPDITVFANSLMTDPVAGGLKQDLSLLSAVGLPAADRTKRLYKDHGVIKDTVPSDPYLAVLTDYHNLYKRLGKSDGRARPGPSQMALKMPARGFNPYDLDTPQAGLIRVNRAAPSEQILMPSLLRVDMIFSMIVRNTHGTWQGRYGAGRYLLHMQYLPVVTIHNPYSVPLVFEGMKVTFKNLPVGFNFMVDNQKLSTGLVALNQMYAWYATSDATTKDFGVTLVPNIGSSGGTMTLEPGQTRLFGTPKVPPTWTWFMESPGTGADGTHLFDWRNNRTADFEMGPTMLTTSTASAAGFDIDWINPQPLQTAKGTQVAGGNDVGMVALNGNERLGVEFGPYAPPAGKGSFSIVLEVVRNGTLQKAGAINIKYGDDRRLNDLLAKGTSVRYPTARTFPATYPKLNEDPPISAGTIYEDGNTPLKDYVRSKPFMIFSVASKTTLESFLPAKPFVVGNPTNNLADIDLTRNRDPEGGVPIEMIMMPISPKTPAIEENRPQKEGYFFGGNGSLYGTPRATLYELPVLPLQSLAQFRHANLANSGFMPFTTYTVGEGIAHAQIGAESYRHTWTDRSVTLDHTYLANKALWDRYFLSTAADYPDPMLTTKMKTYDQVLDGFFKGESPLLNTRFTAYNPGGMSKPANLSANDAYRSIAGNLLLAGGFNINSTSVPAWKTVLGALSETDIETVLGIDKGETNRAALLRVRRPAEGAIDGGTIMTRQKRWQGYRRLSNEQIDTLAKEIVSVIRTRGPFLSLADFVNRGIGPDSPATTRGAIQEAIDRIKVAINGAVAVDGREVAAADVALASYRSVSAGTGNTAEGAPGYITQGDVLSVIGSRISVRGDTFRIRAFGEAKDSTGTRVLARAWCEAVVQRVPDFVDSTQQSDTQFAELNAANMRFGRRYEIVTFRWLAPDEV